MCEFTQVAILSGFQGVVWAQGLGCQWVKAALRRAFKMKEYGPIVSVEQETIIRNVNFYKHGAIRRIYWV